MFDFCFFVDKSNDNIFKAIQSDCVKKQFTKLPILNPCSLFFFQMSQKFIDNFILFFNYFFTFQIQAFQFIIVRPLVFSLQMFF